jgi:hypothetical protein
MSLTATTCAYASPVSADVASFAPGELRSHPNSRPKAGASARISAATRSRRRAAAVAADGLSPLCRRWRMQRCSAHARRLAVRLRGTRAQDPSAAPPPSSSYPHCSVANPVPPQHQHLIAVLVEDPRDGDPREVHNVVVPALPVRRLNVRQTHALPSLPQRTAARLCGGPTLSAFGLTTVPQQSAPIRQRSTQTACPSRSAFRTQHNAARAAIRKYYKPFLPVPFPRPLSDRSLLHLSAPQRRRQHDTPDL